jgi:hypothetical protein
MARLRGRGTVRRALVRVQGRGAPPPLPVALWSGDRASGELRSAAPAGEGGGFRGLAIVPVASARPGTALGLEKGGAPALEVAAGP